jgi:uncharacterized membrane protein YagU involved in acid resistance
MSIYFGLSMYVWNREWLKILLWRGILIALHFLLKNGYLLLPFIEHSLAIFCILQGKV